MRPIPLSLLLLLLASTALYHVEAAAEPPEQDEYTQRAYMKPGESTSVNNGGVATNVCIEDIYDKTLTVPQLNKFRSIHCDFQTHVCSKEVVGQFIRSECVPKADRSCSKYCLDSANCCCPGNLCTLNGTVVYSRPKDANGKPQWGMYVQQYESNKIKIEHNKPNKNECYAGLNLAKGETPSERMTCLFQEGQACYALAEGGRYSYGCKRSRPADDKLFPLDKDSKGKDAIFATCKDPEKCMCNNSLCNFVDSGPLSPENPNPNNNGTSDPDPIDNDDPPKGKPSNDALSPSLTLAILLSCILLI